MYAALAALHAFAFVKLLGTAVARREETWSLWASLGV